MNEATLMRALEIPAVPPFPSPRRAWTVVALLLVAYTVSLIDRQILSLMVQPIRADLQISDTQLSLLHGLAFAIFYTLFGVFLGRAADKWSRRDMIIAGMTLWCLATAACGMASSFTQLFIARVFVGIGEATLSPAAFSMIADYFPKERRARAMSVYSMGVFWGSGLALVLGGLAITATSQASFIVLPVLGELQSWQAAFIVVGLPGLLVAALMIGVREPARRELSDQGSRVSDTLAFFRANAAALVTMILAFGANGLINFGLASWAPTFFIRTFGWTAGQIGAVYGVILLACGSGGIFVGGWVADRFVAAGRSDGVLRTMRYSSLLMIPSLCLFSVVHSSTSALVALGLATFVLGLPTGLAPVALYAITPNQFRGQVTACYLFSVTLIGMALGATLIALATDYLFKNDMAVGHSLALVTSLAAALSYVCLTISSRVQRWGAKRNTPAERPAEEEAKAP
jgi:MFS family permease